MLPNDRIELRGLVVSGICGALPEERIRRQPLEIDLDVEADLGAAGVSDELADTLDYGAIAARVEAVILGEEPFLLERLAHRLAEALLEDPRVVAVTVSVRKQRPPVPQVMATSGVRITRAR